MNATRFLGWAVVCGCAVAFFGGCGSEFKLGQVSGTVTVDGAPVPNLQVLFEPQDKKQPSSIGFTQADGKYKLRCASGVDGAVLGQHTVRVTTVETDDPAGPPLTIPAKYNTSSQLTQEVKAGENTIDLPITRR
jgi:hypothetical protein